MPSNLAIPSALEGKDVACLTTSKHSDELAARRCQMYLSQHHSYEQQHQLNVSCSLGDGGYPFAPQQLGLGAEGVKSTHKYGEWTTTSCSCFTDSGNIQLSKKKNTKVHLKGTHLCVVSGAAAGYGPQQTGEDPY